MQDHEPAIRETTLIPYKIFGQLYVRLNIVNIGNFYRQSKTRPRWVAPKYSTDSDLEVDHDLDLDDDTIDPDFLVNIGDDELVDSTPLPSTSAVQPVQPQDVSDDSSSEDEFDDAVPPARKQNKTTVAARTWQEDINVPPLPEYVHPPPTHVLTPFEYFEMLFSMELVDHIVYQTNLYAYQKDVTTTFNTNKQEIMEFIGILIYMGICTLPSIEDYWAAETRIPQVANVMSSKRFRQLRALLHFSDNEQAHASCDRFYKIRPVITFITRRHLQVEATPVQSIDEVMVVYKGKRASNLRQYIKTKPDKWGFKLFCRGSIDGFIHDTLMYQGETTFRAHHTPLTEKEEMLVSSKTGAVLVKTLKEPNKSAVYADNFFTSISLVEFLKDTYGCRYVGTARVNRISNPPPPDVC
ncbi:hypothetical protein Pcinc_019628 [Petrolisthes cinctipes]|uniref:PiggyBac transposable element-derived protein domain-containing protein n=1 Tax=Petrolisthes cinctipes TaxID=88211 RepID=A0AAE1FKL7_PETCI|nr:hypothetical protein Pcinc_019628 [Petrolisthes cinctipes]